MLGRLINVSRLRAMSAVNGQQLGNPATNLEGHKLVIRPRRPGVDLDRVAQSDDQELDVFVLHCKRRTRGL